MSKGLKNVLVFLVLTLSVFLPGGVLAKYGLPETLNIINSGSQGKLLPTSIAGATTVPQLIGTIISIALGLLGIVFFLLVFYAGFIWMTARGNQDSVTKAKGILEAAVIGLVIVVSSYAISRFVFQSLLHGAAQVGNSGASDTCSKITQEEQCYNNSTCSWAPESGTCVPKTTASCGTITKEDDCLNMSGCAWNAGDSKCELRS
jgi:hypothetical protein